MSFVKDLLLGDEATPGRLEDLRSPEQTVTNDEATKLLRGFLAGGGLNPFGGQTTAGLGDTERQLLERLSAFSGGQFGNVSNAGTTLDNIVRGPAGGTGVNPFAEQLANRPGAASQGFDQIFDIFTGATQDPNNPIVRNAITAATRPILEQFGDQVDRNRNLFTQAGQFVQPGSSSPFELAQSRLSTGLANALGDTSSNIVFQNLQAERGRQSDIFNQIQQGFQLDKTRELQSRGQQLDAANSTVGFERGKLDTLTRALDTAALPRLIEQFGLSEGKDIFENEQKSLLDLLQLAFQSTGSNTVALPGTPGGGGLLGPIAQGFGTAFGGPAGGALAGKLFG